MGYGGFYPNSLYGLETRPLVFVDNIEGKVILAYNEVSQRYLKKNFPTKTFPEITISAPFSDDYFQTDPYHSNSLIRGIDVTGSMTGLELNNLTQADFD